MIAGAVTGLSGALIQAFLLAADARHADAVAAGRRIDPNAHAGSRLPRIAGQVMAVLARYAGVIRGRAGVTGDVLLNLVHPPAHRALGAAVSSHAVFAASQQASDTLAQVPPAAVGRGRIDPAARGRNPLQRSSDPFSA